MNKPFATPSTTFPMRSTAVNFSNGMIVTDSDLTAAMNYPIQLMQAVNIAVYGCGVACGFKFAPDPEFCGHPKPCDPCNPKDPRKGYGFRLQVGRGTAIDCHGMPIELCEPVMIDVSPDACGCKSDGEASYVCIAARRISASEAARSDCCDSNGEAAVCARTRDHVELRAFPHDKLPEHICGHVPDGNGKSDCGCGCGGGDAVATEARASAATYVPEIDHNRPAPNPGQNMQREICQCLIECDPCDCCGEGWVLLGCVELCEAGVLQSNFETQEGRPNPKPYQVRKWIKTIECMCRTQKPESANQEPKVIQSVESRQELTDDFVKELEGAGLAITKRNYLILNEMRLGSSDAMREYILANGSDAKELFGFRTVKDFDAFSEKIGVPQAPRSKS